MLHRLTLDSKSELQTLFQKQRIPNSVEAYELINYRLSCVPFQRDFGGWDP